MFRKVLELIGSDTDPIALFATHLVLALLLVGSTSSKKAQRSVVSNPIGMKSGRIGPRLDTLRLTSRISDMTSYFQDGGPDVILRKKTSSSPRVLSGCVCYSTWTWSTERIGICLDQNLISYCYSSNCSSCCCCSSFSWATHSKSLWCLHFKSDRDEIWQDCSSSRYASTNGVGLLIWRHNFKTTAMTSFHAAKWCADTIEWKRNVCHANM